MRAQPGAGDVPTATSLHRLARSVRDLLSTLAAGDPPDGPCLPGRTAAHATLAYPANRAYPKPPKRERKDKPMPTRNVVLTPHHESVIESLVKSGRYQNASEVLREGLRLIEQREAQEAAKLQALQQAARTGLADLDAGRYRDIQDGELEETFAHLGRRASEQVNAPGT